MFDDYDSSHGYGYGCGGGCLSVFLKVFILACLYLLFFGC